MSNRDYKDKGMFGSYRTSAEPFPNPNGVKLFAGYGADNEDLERGWCDPTMRDSAPYDKTNYYERWTVPSVSDVEPLETGVMPEDVEFRMKERTSRGFLTRPRIPTERN